MRARRWPLRFAALLVLIAAVTADFTPRDATLSEKRDAVPSKKDAIRIAARYCNTGAPISAWRARREGGDWHAWQTNTADADSNSSRDFIPFDVWVNARWGASSGCYFTLTEAQAKTMFKLFSRPSSSSHARPQGASHQ